MCIICVNNEYHSILVEVYCLGLPSLGRIEGTKYYELPGPGLIQLSLLFFTVIPRKPIIKPLSYNLDNQLQLPTTGTIILQPYIMIEVKMQNQR